MIATSTSFRTAATAAENSGRKKGLSNSGDCSWKLAQAANSAVESCVGVVSLILHQSSYSINRIRKSPAGNMLLCY